MRKTCVVCMRTFRCNGGLYPPCTGRLCYCRECRVELGMREKENLEGLMKRICVLESILRDCYSVKDPGKVIRQVYRERLEKNS